MGSSQNPSQLWRSTVLLWKSALDFNGLQSMVLMIARFNLTQEHSDEAMTAIERVLRKFGDLPAAVTEIIIARLTGDNQVARSLAYGLAITDSTVFNFGLSWLDEMLASLIPLIADIRIDGFRPKTPRKARTTGRSHSSPSLYLRTCG